MSDLVTELRRAVLIALKADSDWTGLVPAARTWGQQAPANPTRPFAKMGTPIASPHEGGACLHGERIRLTMYVSAGPRKSGGQVVETAEDHIGRIIAALKGVLHRGNLDITGGYAKLFLINDIRRQVDGEADVFEANIEFRAKMMAA